MNVLMVEPFGHREGHPSVTSRRFAGAFADSGGKVTLVTFVGLRDDWSAREERVEHTSVFRRSKTALWLQDRLNRYPLVRSVLRILETFATLARALWMNRTREHDVIFILDAEPVFFACLSLALFCKDRRFVITVYNPPPSPAEWRSGFRGLRRKLRPTILADVLRYLIRTLVETRVAVAFRSALYRRALAKHHILFVCESRWIEEAYSTYLGGIFQGRFVWIPLAAGEPPPPVGRQEARRALGLPEDKTVLLSFGNNHPGKDLRVVFQALAGLDEDCFLVQAGKLGVADDSSDPRRLAERYGCAQKSRIDDRFVPEEEALLYFFAADAVILSYRRHFIQYASILNDAARCSTPVIASDVGQLGEFVKAYRLGFTFTPEDAASLRQAILSFLGLSEEEREKMRVNARAFAARYPWEESAKRYLEAFDRVVGA